MLCNCQSHKEVACSKCHVSENLTKAIDTIANYLSKFGPNFVVSSDLYEVNFSFNQESELGVDEITENDEFGIIAEKPSYTIFRKSDNELICSIVGNSEPVLGIDYDIYTKDDIEFVSGKDGKIFIA